MVFNRWANVLIGLSKPVRKNRATLFIYSKGNIGGGEEEVFKEGRPEGRINRKLITQKGSGFHWIG